MSHVTAFGNEMQRNSGSDCFDVFEPQWYLLMWAWQFSVHYFPMIEHRILLLAWLIP